MKSYKESRISKELKRVIAITGYTQPDDIRFYVHKYHPKGTEALYYADDLEVMLGLTADGYGDEIIRKSAMSVRQCAATLWSLDDHRAAMRAHKELGELELPDHIRRKLLDAEYGTADDLIVRTEWMDTRYRNEIADFLGVFLQDVKKPLASSGGDVTLDQTDLPESEVLRLKNAGLELVMNMKGGEDDLYVALLCERVRRFGMMGVLKPQDVLQRHVFDTMSPSVGKCSLSLLKLYDIDLGDVGALRAFGLTHMEDLKKFNAAQLLRLMPELTYQDLARLTLTLQHDTVELLEQELSYVEDDVLESLYTYDPAESTPGDEMRTLARWLNPLARAITNEMAFAGDAITLNQLRKVSSNACVCAFLTMWGAVHPDYVYFEAGQSYLLRDVYGDHPDQDLLRHFQDYVGKGRQVTPMDLSVLLSSEGFGFMSVSRFEQFVKDNGWKVYDDYWCPDFTPEAVVEGIVEKEYNGALNMTPLSLDTLYQRVRTLGGKDAENLTPDDVMAAVKNTLYSCGHGVYRAKRKVRFSPKVRDLIDRELRDCGKSSVSANLVYRHYEDVLSRLSNIHTGELLGHMLEDLYPLTYAYEDGNIVIKTAPGHQSPKTALRVTTKELERTVIDLARARGGFCRVDAVMATLQIPEDNTQDALGLLPKGMYVVGPRIFISHNSPVFLIMCGIGFPEILTTQMFSDACIMCGAGRSARQTARKALLEDYIQIGPEMYARKDVFTVSAKDAQLVSRWIDEHMSWDMLGMTGLKDSDLTRLPQGRFMWTPHLLLAVVKDALPQYRFVSMKNTTPREVRGVLVREDLQVEDFAEACARVCDKMKMDSGQVNRLDRVLVNQRFLNGALPKELFHSPYFTFTHDMFRRAYATSKFS